MASLILRGNTVAIGLDSDDRGINYGDGVFETILIHHGQSVWWPEHWQRMQLGAQRLGLTMPDEGSVQAHAQSLITGNSSAVLKIVLTRGIGGRGYGAARDMLPTVVISTHPLPPPINAPIKLRWCQTPLAIQPVLAGIKHLNRLEQVLARAEWNDPEIFDGLMCDTEGRAICATAGNLFIRRKGRWLTPKLHRCGVAGVARAWLLANVLDIEQVDLWPADVESSEAIFLCNAVRGILPVSQLGLNQWHYNDEVSLLRRQLANAQPAFSDEEQ